MRYPLDIVDISSPYGMRIHPVTGEYKLHNGVDLRGANGTPIYAIASGVVSKNYYNSIGGNQVIIEHRNDLRSGNAHLSSSLVEVGQKVRKGDLIGYVGSSGAVTGPHLHFTLRKNDELVDPIAYIKKIKMIYGISLIVVAGIVIYIFRKKIL